MPFPYVIKIGRALKAPKKLAKFAWRLVVDRYVVFFLSRYFPHPVVEIRCSNRTLAPLQYPPHTIALACIYLAALLASFEQPPQMEGVSENRTNEEIVRLLGEHGEWEQRYKACVEDLEGMWTCIQLFHGLTNLT